MYLIYNVKYANILWYLADSKKDAEEEVNREISGVQNIVELRFVRVKKCQVNWGKGTEKEKAMERNLNQMKVKKDWMQLMTKIKMVSIHCCLPVL